MAKLERILVPVDFSPASKAALEYGLMLAGKVGASLDILHVAHPQKVRGDDDVAVLHRGVPGSTLEAYSEEEIQGELTEFVKQAGLDRQVRLDEIEEHRDPAECIVKIAKEKEVDLIVMGAHARKGLDRFFAGSVTRKVGESAPCPVTICHPAPAAAE